MAATMLTRYSNVECASAAALDVGGDNEIADRIVVIVLAEIVEDAIDRRFPCRQKTAPPGKGAWRA